MASTENVSDALAIGRRKTARSGLVGCLLIYIIMSLLGGPLWILEVGFNLSILTGLIVFSAGIYWIGGLTGYLILIKRLSGALTAIVSAFLIVWCSALAGGLTAFLQTDTGFWSESWMWSYTFKPVAFFTFWGGIPIFILAIWSGVSIEKHAPGR